MADSWESNQLAPNGAKIDKICASYVSALTGLGSAVHVCCKHLVDYPKKKDVVMS